MSYVYEANFFLNRISFIVPAFAFHIRIIKMINVREKKKEKTSSIDKDFAPSVYRVTALFVT